MKTNKVEPIIDPETQEELCPWCKKPTCEWFIGLPCTTSGHTDHTHPGQILDNEPNDWEDDDDDDADCDHCACYWDAIDGIEDEGNPGQCCDCGRLA